MEPAFDRHSLVSLGHQPRADVPKCPNCNSGELTRFFDVEQLPVNVGNFYDTHEAASNAPSAPVSLHYCENCGLVHNHAFERDGEIFEPGYEVSLRHSETFRTFIGTVAERLVKQFDLNGKKITEIGCGDAYFLESVASLGGNECVGIDPTIVIEEQRPAGKGNVALQRGYFSERHVHYVTDFICCLSVFEDIPKLPEFLSNVHMLASRNNAPIYFEVFNAWRAFEQSEVWSVHYEQCNYFSLESLRNVFRQHGFTIQNSGTCYSGDQYLFVEAVAHAPSAGYLGTENNSSVMPVELATFSQNFEERKSLWEERFDSYRNSGQKVVLWGSGGKGITFLNSVPGSDLIKFVAEINPDKHGKYLPVTGQKVIPIEALVDVQPDKIIITNPIYKKEMMQQASDLGLSAEFLVA